MVIPGLFSLRNVLLAGGLALAAAGGWYAEHLRMGAEMAHLVAKHATELATMADTGRKAEAEHRETEAGREAMKGEIAHVASLARVHAESDHAAVVAGRDGLLRAYRAAAGGGQGCQDSSPGRPGEAAAAAAGLREQLFAEAVELAEGFAAAFDRAYIAGLACEASYTSIRAEHAPDAQ